MVSMSRTDDFEGHMNHKEIETQSVKLENEREALLRNWTSSSHMHL